MPIKTLTHKDYKVGWICALPKEQAAAIAMLDERHTNLSKPSSDTNTYALGSISGHNIVMACLPKGKYGTISAATVAIHMVNTFPAIRFGLMVGIGGGIPPKVRLGDVVVSVPADQYPAVVQWDMNKAEQGGTFKRTGALNSPPTLLLTALSRLETEQRMIGSRIPDFLGELAKKYPRLTPKYLRSGLLHDVLFKANHDHISREGKLNDIYRDRVDDDTAKSDKNDVAKEDEGEGEESEEFEEDCRNCNKAMIVKRKPREMKIHYGLIASGNQIIKNAEYRGSLVKELGGNVLCIEGEAAGLMDNFPCIIIRGICDYADSHKNKDWQEHAAAVAAAYAKELLGYVVPGDVDGEKTVKDTHSDISQIVKSIKEDTTKTQHILNTEEDIKILNWLSVNQYGAQQSDTLKRWHPQTGKWFLCSEQYQDWLQTKKRTLYCPGIPGAGKTIISSAVIHDLSYRLLTNSNEGLAYVFFTFSRQREQNVEHVFASLLRQFLKGFTTLPGHIRRLYSHHRKNSTKPTYADLYSALSLVISGHKRAFILMDALDECTTEHQCRAKILTDVIDLQARFGVNILATSRIHDEIASKFCKDTIILPIIARNEDIEIVLRSRMGAHDPELFDEDFSNIAASEITKVTDGMFLLADLHLNTLIGLPTKGDIRNALHNLSKSTNPLNTVYELAMERIQSQGSGYGRLATMILLWIVHARRPMSTPEIQHALAVRPNTETIDKDYCPSVKTLKSICAGLVTIDEESDTIRLIHYTTQEYFEQTQGNWFQDAQDTITRTCVTYLSFQNFTGHCNTDEEFEQRLLSYPFYIYAAHNWGYHACTSSANSEVIRFLQRQGQVQASSQALEAVKRGPWDTKYTQRVPRAMTGLHMAALFGVDFAVKALLSTCPIDTKDSYGQSPLILAAKNGHAEVVKMLLDTGNVDANAKDTDYGQTPLSWTVQGGHIEVVKLLLDTKNVDVDAKDTVYGRTPLSWAADAGNIEVVKLLLNTGKVEFDLKDGSGRTPLSRAVGGGHVEVVQLLLTIGNIGVDLRDDDNRAPLSWAASGGHAEVVKLLLDIGNVDIDAKDTVYGQTPLLWAAEGGYLEVVRLLLDSGNVDVDAKDTEYGRTPLLWAAKSGYVGVVKLLLDTGNVDIDARDTDYGQTPLIWAAKSGYVEVVKLLLDTGNVKVDAKDKLYGWTPLLWAAESGYAEVVKLILDTGIADVDAKDTKYGWTPLSLAAKLGYVEVVKLLLATRNIDIDAKDTVYGWTPLSWAVEGGYIEVVKLLLDTGNVDVDAKDTKYGRTPLSWATENGDKTMASVLLAYGANLSVEDRSGLSPLHRAVFGGQESLEPLFVSNGGSLDDVYGLRAMFDA